MLKKESASSSAWAYGYRSYIYVSLAVFVFFWLYYVLLVDVMQKQIDIPLHVKMLYRACSEGRSIPANFGFYGLVYLLSGLDCNYRHLLLIGLPVLGLAWGGTVYLSARMSGELLAPSESTDDRTQSKVLLVAVLSCFIFPLPVSFSSYLPGLLPANVYHNSTIICSFPFAVWAFVLGLKRLRTANQADWQADYKLTAILCIGLIFKPSYAFAFIPAYSLLYAYQVRFKLGALWRLALPVLPVLLLIGAQLWWTSTHQDSNMDTHESHVSIAFPAGWRTYVPQFTVGRMFACFITSFALPILAYLARPQWLARLSHQFALLSIATAMAVFMLFYETGERAIHGNFVWQVIASNHVLHWVILLELFFWRPIARAEYWKRMALLAFTVLNIACASIYLTRLVVVGNAHDFSTMLELYFSNSK
jgi:hypothetical protein